ncbi:hypothetical protein EVA_09670 [gut metagenome]|uniref:Uncharacterized protein n=1 Tax=gut metagenome TaxID=749906 RepID=J9GQB7_9ZZZZ
MGWSQTYTGTALWRKGKEEPFAWIWRGKTGEKCFDILQKEEVESAMLAETAAAVGSTEGFAKAEVSEINRIYGKLQVPWLDQLGYHTKYEQNLEKFWQQEKQYRLSEMEDDRPMEAFAGENQNTNYRNDYFVICLKDPTVTTPEGYENVMPAREEEFARYEAAFRQIEEKYHTELEVALYLTEEQMPVTMLYKKGKSSALTGILVTGSEAGKRNENTYELMEEVYERKGGAK